MLGKAVGQAEKLGGIGAIVAKGLEELTGKEARTVVLGHLLRGGSPTAFDRLLGLRFGAAAIRALEEGERGVMVALDPPNVRYVPLGDANEPVEDRPPRLRRAAHRPRHRNQLRGSSNARTGSTRSQAARLTFELAAAASQRRSPTWQRAGR